MKKYFSKWLQTFSGSLKVLLVIVFMILSPLSFAKDDIADTANYLPGGQYRMFGGGRGVVSNVKNNIHSSTSVLNVGVVQFTKTRYSGSVSYQQDFSNHGWRVHSPFSSSQTRSLTNFYGSIGDRKAGVVKGNVTGWEVHPADGYEGEQGGDYPSPTGARDEYAYEVSGESYSVGVKPNNEKAPISPENQANPNQNENKGYNDRLPENNPTDANDRTRDLTGSGNLPNSPNGQPENSDVANNGEVPLPQDVTKDKSNWATDLADVFWGGLKELAAGARDYQADGAQYGVPVGAWGDGNQYAHADPYAPSNYAEGVGANVAAIGSVIGARNPTSLGRNVAKYADDVAKAAANAAKKVEKAGDAATDLAKAQQDTINDILKNSQKGQKTTGKARQYEKTGDFDTAKKDFESLKPTNVQHRENGVTTGTLADGRNVIVRPKSRSEKPTLEIQNTPNNYTKIRYGE